MKKLFYVYQLRAENEILPFYIGKGLGQRINYHFKKCNLKGRTLKENKINSLNNQKIKILREKLFESENELLCLNLECFLICIYGRRDIKTGILCNHTDGGEGVSGKICSQETKDKMSLSRKGRKIINPKSGHKFTEEHKNNISKGNIGKHSTWGKGRKLSQEQKAILLKANLGRECPFKGIKKGPRSEETKLKISQAKKGKTPRKGHITNRNRKRDINERNKTSKYSREFVIEFMRKFFSCELSFNKFCQLENIPVNTAKHWLHNEFILSFLK